MLIQLPTYAENAALPASAATPAVQQSIYRRHTAAKPLHAATAGGWDRRTDGQTCDRSTDTVPFHIMWAVPSVKVTINLAKANA